jgi:hypothetical protein
MLHRRHVALWNCVEDIAHKEVRCRVPVGEEGRSIFELGYGICHEGDTSSFHTPSQADSSFHTLELPFRHITHQPRSSMVYPPFSDGLHTALRWFTHRPLRKRRTIQMLSDCYPQRNTLFNRSI